MSIEKSLKEKNYLPILSMDDGTIVTRTNWALRRSEMLSLLMKHSYGKTPTLNVKVMPKDIEYSRYDCAGKCTHEKLFLTYQTDLGVGEFPIQIFRPIATDKPPVFLHIAFGLAPHWYIPIEQIIDAGYALVVVDYRDMVNDNLFGDFSDGIAAHFNTSDPREKDEWGKIGMWAWGTSRIMDYLIEHEVYLLSRG